MFKTDGWIAMKITYLSCFANERPGSGNKAAVVQDFAENDEAKQKLAKELALPVIVFIEQNRLLFFYPETEMSMCNHGALAAAAVLLRHSNANEVQVFNREGKRLYIKKQGEQFTLECGKAEILPVKVSHNEIVAMLNLSNPNVVNQDLPCVVASVGSPKLLVPLISLHELKALSPNFALIKSWSLSNQVNGLYVYTQDVSEYDFYTRAFNPKTGNNEDAATGVAAGALLGALGMNGAITIGQGEGLGHPSLIVARSHNANIAVGGRVVFNE
ncbi:MAG: phenazine biosynthesis protein PhzF family [Gammaproteobacteria bacterium]|jgi:PhzF family phenazine biosynthesis protein|nr:phenazine biosynthesis protein PhzF family [Gammaproteobacteria bacterium]